MANFDDLGEMVDEFLNQNKIYSFEGSKGIDNFLILTKALNPEYNNLDYFLQDNPDALDAVVNWIKNSDLREWKESLSDELGITIRMNKFLAELAEEAWDKEDIKFRQTLSTNSYVEYKVFEVSKDGATDAITKLIEENIEEV